MDRATSMLSPDQRRVTDIPDPYAFDDMGKSRLTNLLPGTGDDKSRGTFGDVSRSANTVMKRPQMLPPRVIDFTQDPIALGIRPSTAIQLQQIEKRVAYNKSLPPSKKG